MPVDGSLLQSCGSNRWLKCVCALEAVFYAIALLVFAGFAEDWGRMYSIDPHHRAQTKAFFRGELHISADVKDVAHDLCWAEAGVQQVWGLGVPLCRTPFEALAMLCGMPAFPETAALGLFVLLVAYVVMQTVLITNFEGTSKMSLSFLGSSSGVLGGVVLLLVFPPFLSLMRCRGAVFETVVTYVYLYGLLLMCGVVALARRPSRRRFWFVCGLAGLGGLVRPTLVFYGFATVATAAALMWWDDGQRTAGPVPQKRIFGSRFWKSWSLWVGLSFFVAGGVVLWWTNLLRFGDGFEFGHRLNMQKGSLLGSIYATRFDHPFENEPLWRAGRELFGALFMGLKFNGSEWYAQGIFGGQSPTARWREFYFTIYDLSYALLVAAGWVAGAGALWKWRKTVRSEVQGLKPIVTIGQEASLTRDAGGNAVGDASMRARLAGALPISGVLALWSILACLPLVFFYLRTPAISSRYMMDFAPAFAVAMVVAWWRAVATACRLRPQARWPHLVLWILLLGWLGWKIVRAESAYGPARSITWENVVAWEERTKREPQTKPLPSSYTRSENWDAWGIPYNGAGWDTNGAVQVSVILFVESPQFLELELAAVPGSDTTEANPQHIRAKVGLEFLQRETIDRTPEGWRVRFAGPARARYQRGIQPVFIATVPKERLADTQTPWLLKQVSWRPSKHLELNADKAKVSP
jgi:hypothetical protein